VTSRSYLALFFHDISDSAILSFLRLCCPALIPLALTLHELVALLLRSLTFALHRHLRLRLFDNKGLCVCVCVCIRIHTPPLWYRR
jgi:hypothetical protein